LHRSSGVRRLATDKKLVEKSEIGVRALSTKAGQAMQGDLEIPAARQTKTDPDTFAA
jgi:hypothetical protein